MLMVDYKTFNLDSFVFRDEAEESWRDRFRDILAKIVRPRVMLQASPVTWKEDRESAQRTFLEDLVASVGLYKTNLQPVLVFHNKRLHLRQGIRRIVYQLSSLALLLLFVIGLFALMKIVKPLVLNAELEARFLSKVIEAAIIITFQLMFLLVAARIAFSLASALTNKNFAESLCVMVAVYIVVDLSRDDILLDPRKRKTLVTRLNDLARVTRLLAVRYGSKNETNQQWINSHFGRLQHYILERARWAVAPTTSTLNDLRQDFYKLACMYVAGSYGSFSWELERSLPERSPAWTNRIFRAIPSLLGIVAPMILMVVLLREPHYLETVGISSNVVALVLIAWVLLAIDGALKLGVVAGIANLAKEIKSLK
jgi:hypothetical protein